MIHSLQIRGYRAFDHFQMNGLGRINLLVGTNNSGKTSVLEALYLLTGRGDPTSLWQILWRRGERMPDIRNPQYDNPEADLCHLFHGHTLEQGAKFTLSAKNQTPEWSVTFSIGGRGSKDQETLYEPQVSDRPVPDADATFRRLSLHIRASQAPRGVVIPLTQRGGIRYDAIESPRIVRSRGEVEGRAQYISTESLTGDELVRLWDRVALSKDEALVLEALQFVDPEIERLAAQAFRSYYGPYNRGGFIVKRTDFEHPIPIGSLGDGMWRMLALAIALTQSKGGVLLVDEIDTGLHYTVMADMWRLIASAAKAFDVQVFATTHSSDCVNALGAICRTDPNARSDVSIQRIERTRKVSVPFSELEVRMAADHEIEVR